MPSFSFPLCLGLVRKFVVVGGWGVETNYSVKLKLYLKLEEEEKFNRGTESFLIINLY